MVHLVDYTEYKPAPKARRVFVELSSELEFSSIEFLGSYKPKMNLCYEDGMLRGFEVEIRARESMLFKLVK